jgi:hypothetical protein
VTAAADLDRSRRYLKPVPRLALPDEPDVVHLAVYAWEPKFSEWIALSPALCGHSTEQGDLPMDATVTCPGCLDYRARYQTILDAQAARNGITYPTDPEARYIFRERILGDARQEAIWQATQDVRRAHSSALCAADEHAPAPDGCHDDGTRCLCGCHDMKQED